MSTRSVSASSPNASEHHLVHILRIKDRHINCDVDRSMATRRREEANAASEADKQTEVTRDYKSALETVDSYAKLAFFD